MPGLRIYYVPPRLVGAVSDWSGLNSPDGQSWLVTRAKSMGFNAIWLSPMHETTNITKTKHGARLSGSLYAIKNHFVLDREFSATPGSRDGLTEKDIGAINEEDRKHLRHFVKIAKENGVKVMADLVFNHVAADHPLVTAESADIRNILETCKKEGRSWRHDIDADKNLIGIKFETAEGEKSYHFKFRRELDFRITVAGPKDDPWQDVAHINHESPAAREFFVTGKDGKKGYWKQQIDWYQSLGFEGFRCDVAYMVPPETWRELIAYAKSRDHDTVFLAETLGQDEKRVMELGKARLYCQKNGDRPAFDLGMIGVYWWDYKQDWLPKDEHPRIHKMAHFGGAGSPDNHDTASTIAGHYSEVFRKHSRRERIVSDICVRDYAIATFICNSVYMQMGYELCKEKQNEVFRESLSPQDWKNLTAGRDQKTHPLNIRQRIAAINKLKADLGVENCHVEFKDYSKTLHNDRVLKIQVSYKDIRSGAEKAEVVLLINKNPEAGPVIVTEKQMEDTGHRHLDRLVLGEKDRTERTALRDIMILHTPVSPVSPSQAVSSAPPPAHLHRKRRALSQNL